ncbi:MAG: O-antigen ligase family protein [Candidatus Moranbacteria bacterium]|nr:O-antigen ligase family protein [Candidatus Moranbacteria bacterium]
MKKLFNLENFIFITIIFLPLYLVKVVILGVPSNLFELIVVFAILAFAMASVGSKIELQDYKKYFIPIVLIISGLLISTIYNDAYRVGFGIIKSWFVVPIIFAFVAVKTLGKAKKETVLNVIYLSALGVACVSLAYFFLGLVTFDGRLQAFFNSPNYLAMFLTPAIVIGVAKLAENKKLYGTSLLIMLISLYLTFSYAAWLALFSSLVILFLKKEVETRHGLVSTKISKKLFWVAFFGLSIIFLQIGSDKMQNLTHVDSRSSLASRAMIWRSAGKMIADNPIVGIGPGNFQNKYLAYQQYFPPYLEWAVPQPHNIFLAFWLQAGILGLVGFIYLMSVWFIDVFRKKDDVSIVCMAIMTGIIIHGLFDTTYFKNDLAVIFWLIFFLGIKNRNS